MDRDHELLVQRMPGSRQAADIAASLALAIILRDTTGTVLVIRLRRVNVIDGQIHCAEFGRQLGNCGLKEAGTINPEIIGRIEAPWWHGVRRRLDPLKSPGVV